MHWVKGLKAKKMGLFKNSSSTSGYHYPEIGNNFENISAKTKKNLNFFWGIAEGPRYYIDSCKKPDIKNLMLVSL